MSLTFMFDLGAQRQTLRAQSSFTTLGREPGVDLIIAHPTVSRQHVLIYERPEVGYILRVLASHNVTLHDGVQVAGELILPDRSVLQLGEVKIDVLALRPSALPARKGDPSISAQSAPSLAPSCHVEHNLDGITHARRFVHRDVITLGREPERDLVLDHPTVSRHHADLVYQPQLGFCLHVRTTQGWTSLNGDPLDPGAKVLLPDKALVQLGQQSFMFHAEPPEPGASGTARTPEPTPPHASQRTSQSPSQSTPQGGAHTYMVAMLKAQAQAQALEREREELASAREVLERELDQARRELEEAKRAQARPPEDPPAWRVELTSRLDEALREAQRTRRELDLLEAALTQAVRERDASRREAHALLEERNAARRERDEALRVREAAVIHADQAASARDDAALRLEQLQAELEPLRQEVDELRRAHAKRAASPSSTGDERPWALAALGLTRGATQEDIKRAYRLAVAKVHPDRGGAEEGFQALQAAYDALRERP